MNISQMKIVKHAMGTLNIAQIATVIAELMPIGVTATKQTQRLLKAQTATVARRGAGTATLKTIRKTRFAPTAMTPNNGGCDSLARHEYMDDFVKLGWYSLRSVLPGKG